ncbi:hypothetical protein [Phenylobacterium sp.]|uniref:hypothetical protein n=1 Tax=Phenylobacterium sp. TaxID=1871053 RepID=UPI002DE6FA4A|nr:hypothetical protein [Phenylobacterium sp.]
MSEFLGGAEADDAAAESAGAGTSAAAVAIALQRARSRKRGGQASAEDRFLEEQSGLIADQRRHLHEQLKTIRLKHFGEVLKVTLQVLTILVGVLLLGGFAAMAWHAAHDESLVIEGIGSPPDLAAKGVTAAALSTGLEDRLSQMRSQTASPVAAAEVREAVANEVKVEIPETGVSVGEVSRALRDWLGHETHVTGEVSHITSGPEAGGLALSLRISGQPGVRLVQADGDQEALLQRGAEQIYQWREPLRYSAYLQQHGRPDESVAVLKHAVATAPTPQARAEALSVLSGAVNMTWPPLARRALLVRAMKLVPGRGSAYVNVVSQDYSLGRWELALNEARTAQRMPPPPASAESGKTLWRLLGESNQGLYLNDYSRELTQACGTYEVEPCQPTAIADAVLGDEGTELIRNDPVLAVGGRLPAFVVRMARIHAVTPAARLLAAKGPSSAGPDASLTAAVASTWVFAAVEIDQQREDWAAVLRDSGAWETITAPWPGLIIPMSPELNRALALAKLGDVSAAEALVGRTPRDCYPCLRMRGRVAAVKGDMAGANHWFAEAARQAPSLPMADDDWGRALLEAGDAAGAAAHGKAAIAKSPNDADGLTLWGEALLAQGDAKAAADKLGAAAKLAPWWGRVRLKHAEALAKLGRADEARAELRAAAGLDLAPSERAELAGRKV